MRTLMNDSAVDDSVINDIADSPTLWWGVQRQISEQKEASRSPWPPVAKFWRLLMIGVPVAAAAVLAVTFYLLPDREAVRQTAEVAQPAVTGKDVQAPVPAATDKIETGNVVAASSVKTSQRPANRKERIVTAHYIKSPVANLPATVAKTVTKEAEIKSDFIALSYARSPESGQIVRVKVPSSMMVTLGLVATVEKPSVLVDAEVLVGDDGMTHSIRFIR